MMDFLVATIAKNTKIMYFIIFSIMVNMMNNQFFCCIAKVTFIWEKFESFLSIICSIFIMAIKFSAFRVFIATRCRTKVLFKIFRSRLWERKFFSTVLTISSNFIKRTNRFMLTCRRTTNSFMFTNVRRAYFKNLFTIHALNINFCCLKRKFAFNRAKQIFRSFCFPQLSFKGFIAMCAVNFHIRHDSTREVLCTI